MASFSFPNGKLLFGHNSCANKTFCSKRKVFGPTAISFKSRAMGIIGFMNSGTTVATAVTGTSSSSATAPLEIEVREIKEKSKKWLWKGQYSINYFVSHPHDEEKNSGSHTNPPVLLVHGFGASIPHWRRFVF